MSKARTIRFTEQIDALVDEYTNKNGLKLNQLVNIAVKKFISEPNAIELEPVDAKDSEWEAKMKKAFSKHRKAMDELS
ncbi:MAG: hypothetical protein ISR65_07620 [Bacteriovoracaceae bacterium]|nr:hypothetical protein [Bacteriovoracaceae bacterium]